MIKVYHGSYTEIRKPDISFSREALDFGRGFYVTAIYEQAVRWANRWARKNNHAVVNTYKFDDIVFPDSALKVKIFSAYDAEWLRFVADNRNGKVIPEYDLIRGGIANDKVFNTLELYFDQLITEEQALQRLQYEQPNDQICIRKQSLIERFLVFESSEVSDGSK